MQIVVPLVVAAREVVQTVLPPMVETAKMQVGQTKCCKENESVYHGNMNSTLSHKSIKTLEKKKQRFMSHIRNSIVGIQIPGQLREESQAIARGYIYQIQDVLTISSIVQFRENVVKYKWLTLEKPCCNCYISNIV